MRARAGTMDLIGQAVAALVAHRLRTALSGLGLIVGIASIITALAVGDGARRAALAEIGALGLTNLFVRSAGKEAVASVLTVRDLRAIEDTLETELATSAVRAVLTPVTSRRRSAPAVLAGVSQGWFEVFDVALAAGRGLSPIDQRERRRVALVGASLGAALFDDEDPVGAHVLAGGNWYVVVGVMQSRRARVRPSPVQSIDVERALIVPLETMDVRLGRGDGLDRVQEIGIRLSEASAVERTAEAVAALLAARHGDGRDYELIIPRDLLRARLAAQRTFTMMLLALGLVALGISGVGIMNIMLANIAERTSEIGVRRAFGARRRDIILQFSAEAALLCAAGGLAGVPAGVAASAAVAWLAGWPVAVSLSAVCLSLGLATAVGVTFGTYPARRAADVSPIDALRAA